MKEGFDSPTGYVIVRSDSKCAVVLFQKFKKKLEGKMPIKSSDQAVKNAIEDCQIAIKSLAMWSKYSVVMREDNELVTVTASMDLSGGFSLSLDDNFSPRSYNLLTTMDRDLLRVPNNELVRLLTKIKTKANNETDKLNPQQ